jgi:integrase/recombinase XerD
VERGLAAHTLEAYRRDLHRYSAALQARGRSEIGEVSTQDVADFLAGLRRLPPARRAAQ